MTELTDLEICKRIAEIELECDWVVGDNTIDLVGTQTYLGAHGMPDERTEKYGEYNPLTDDALCFNLMQKYEVSVDFDCQGAWLGSAYLEWEIGTSIDTLSKAICLLIIEECGND